MMDVLGALFAFVIVAYSAVYAPMGILVTAAGPLTGWGLCETAEQLKKRFPDWWDRRGSSLEEPFVYAFSLVAALGVTWLAVRP